MIRDPQIRAFIAATEAAYPPEANGASAADNRRYYDAMCAAFRAPRPEGLAVADRQIGGVACRVYGSGPGLILYAHGGGFVVGGLESHDDLCAEIADATGATLVAVDYRLAPEHRWPAQLDDLRAVWDALEAEGQGAGVQGRTPAGGALVMGDSAGGLLAAALCLALRADGRRLPAAQILIYPGLGGDGTAPSYRENAEAPLLRTADLGLYHAALFGPEGRRDPLAAPIGIPDLSGLPPAVIVTADVDPLRDDGRDYAARLAAAGVPAIWRNEAELPHGYLRARRQNDRARRSVQFIIAQAAARLGGGGPAR